MMISFFKCLAVIILACVFCHAPAFAQQAAPAASPTALDKKIPDAYLQEADQIHSYCQSTSKMNFYYNCDCMAMRYLDRRIAEGPIATQNGILLELQGQCHDAANAAGYEYGQCQQSASLLPDGTDVEKFCACVGNTYGKLFENSNLQPTSKNFVELKSRAQTTCRDPQLARDLYPDLPASH